MTILKLSDLVSGAICMTYDVLMGQNFNTTRGLEQVAYRVVGRKVNENTNMPYVALPVVSENDVYSAVTAVGDNMLRKKQSTNASLYAGVRSLLSSAGADYALTSLNIVDKQLF